MACVLCGLGGRWRRAGACRGGGASGGGGVEGARELDVAEGLSAAVVGRQRHLHGVVNVEPAPAAPPPAPAGPPPRVDWVVEAGVGGGGGRSGEAEEKREGGEGAARVCGRRKCRDGRWGQRQLGMSPRGANNGVLRRVVWWMIWNTVGRTRLEYGMRCGSWLLRQCFHHSG